MGSLGIEHLGRYAAFTDTMRPSIVEGLFWSFDSPCPFCIVRLRAHSRRHVHDKLRV